VPFGARLRGLRERAGLTQEELASRAGLSPNAVGALERGVRRRPHPHTVRSLSDALELSEEERVSLRAAVPKRAKDDEGTSFSNEEVYPASFAVSALPHPATPLVGRERELEEVSGLLALPEVRLLTLTGIGGVGKTRLAVEVVREAAGLFADGAAFVGLAQLADPSLVVPTVLRSLGVPESEGRTAKEALIDYLRDKSLLLVLDNLEHLLQAAPEVAALIEVCPGLVVMATSRAPLRIRGEREYPVPPLALPASTRLPSEEEVLASPSGKLFSERARAASPAFELTGENVVAVASICWRLAGLPLALELAAAKARFLDPATLLSRLDTALSSAWARDLPERQRTMRATLDWSHGLLSEPEASLFRRLAIFVGGFSLEAAEAVEDTECGAKEVLDLLGALVEQSLVKAEPQEGETRYSMLEPVRQYALQKLEESGEGERARERHAAYYEALVLWAGEEIEGTRQAEWMERLDREHDNLRVMEGWLLERGEAERATEVGWVMRWFWVVRGFLEEGRRWMGRVLASGETLSPSGRAKALAVTGTLAWAQGTFDRAATALTEASRIARETGDRSVLAFALRMEAYTALAQGDHARVATRADESFLLHSALGEASSASLSLLAMAHAAGARGDPDRAVRLLDESEALAREAGSPFSIASVLNVRAVFMQLGGDEAGAVDLLRESLGLSRALRNTYSLGFGLIRLSGALAALGQGERAARLCGAAEALREVTGISMHSVGTHRVLYERQVAALRERLDAETFEAAWAEGRAMTLEEAVGEALGERK
jgi:predicted ATPase/DNA-binding XRE family transcriptional regulator